MTTTTDAQDLAVYDLFVDGRWQPSVTGRTSERTSPGDGRLVGRYARGDGADVDLAVAAARRAFDDGPWPTIDATKRAAIAEAMTDVDAVVGGGGGGRGGPPPRGGGPPGRGAPPPRPPARPYQAARRGPAA